MDFNENDTYLFKSPFTGWFESKVHFERGYWWTNENLQFKAKSIECKPLHDK